MPIKKRVFDSVIRAMRRVYIKLLFGNRVIIDKGAEFGADISLEIGPGGTIKFGEGCVIGKNVDLSCYSGGQIQINKGCVIKSGAVLQTIDSGRLSIGENCHLGMNTVICAKSELNVGDGCQIAEMVSIRDHDHRFRAGVDLTESGLEVSKVKIGRNVWIGAKATITKGVEIGSNCIIGANAVVTADIPANSVAVGVPAKVIKSIKN